MLFTELLKMAALSLIANKLRTLLTMLGIIIGVASVVSLVAVGMGVRQNVTDSISRLGSNMVSDGKITKDIITAQTTEKIDIV